MATPGNNSWCRGRIEPWWGQLHHGLPYANEPFNDPQAEAQWRPLGFTQTRFTGDMYDMRNPELFWITPFRKCFDFTHFSWSVYRMAPGTVLPEHQDTYQRFREIHRLSLTQSVVRAIVFLEDWQRGHYLELNGHPIVQWQAGDWVQWRDDLPHIAANVGKTPRYTLQITGI